MGPRLSVVVAVGIALSVPAPAAAAIRYVDDSGSDAGGLNSCTTATAPCRTINHALDVGDSTDTYDVGGGAYNENVVVGGSASLVAANFNAPATAGPAVLDGGAGVAITSSTTGHISGLTVRGNQGAISVTAGAPTISTDNFDDPQVITPGRVQIYNPATAVVDHDLFVGPNSLNSDDGVLANTPGDVRVSSSTFRHVAIGIQNDGNNALTVRDNTITFHGISGNTLGVGLNLQNGTQTVVHNRVTAEPPGITEGVAESSFTTAAFRGNVVRGATHAGVSVFAPGGAVTMDDDVVVGNNTSGDATGVEAGGTTPLRMTNETVVGNGGASQVTADSSVSVDSSIVGNGGIAAPSCSIAFSRGPTTTGGSCQRFQTAAAPGFASATDVHLRPGSPLVDAGNPAAPGPGTVDADGKPRVRDGNGDCVARRDMGAYELQSGRCVRPRCTVRLRSRKVALGGSKRARGRVRVRARCDQNVLASLAGRVRVKRAHRAAASTLLKPRTALLRRNRGRTFRVKLPKRAVRALAAGGKVSARFTLTARNAHGAPGVAKLGYRRLRPKR